MRKKKGKRVHPGRTALSPSQKIAIIVAVIALLILLALPFREFLVGKAGESCSENTFPYTIGLSSRNAEQTITFLDGSTCVVLTARVLADYLTFTSYLNILYNGASLPLTDSGDVNVFIFPGLAGGVLSLDYNADGIDDLTMSFLSVEGVYPVIRFERIGVALAAGAGPTLELVLMEEMTNSMTNSEFTLRALFTISEGGSLVGFSENDIVVTNADVRNFRIEDVIFSPLPIIEYNFVVVPSIEGLVTVTIPASAAIDNNGEGNAAATFSAIYETTRPTVILGAFAPDETGAFVVTVGFSEQVFGFSSDGITVLGATIDHFTSSEDGFGYTFMVIPTPSDEEPFDITITVTENIAQDAAGNWNEASNTITRTYETELPTVTLTTDAFDVSGPFVVTATFRERIFEFGQGDVTISPSSATISGFTGDGISHYQFTVSPSEEGVVAVQIPESAVRDEAGNRNPASEALLVTYDSTAPTATLSTNAQDPVNAPFTVTVNFDKGVMGFSSDGIILSQNARVGTFIGEGGGRVYNFEIIPNVDGLVTVTIPANAAHDVAGNGNEESDTLSRVFDGTSPTVELTHNSNPDSERFGIFHFTAAFSEQVTDFALEDVVIAPQAAAEVSGFSGSGRFYSFVVRATGGAFNVNIPADVSLDTAGNGNAASGVLNINYRPDLTITIRNPNTEPAQQKTITASVSGGGTLTQAVNNPGSQICDETLNFLPYEGRTFYSEGDNGRTICYKAEAGAGNAAYSLSQPIAGIDTTPPRILFSFGENLIAPATSPQGARVVFALYTTADTGENVICSPPSGSFFPFGESGESTVICSAHDAAENVGGGSFTVVIPRRGDINGNHALDIGDLVQQLRHLRRDTTLGANALQMANTDCDTFNQITISDISILARAIANKHQGVACP